jgi:hypothetical protein
VTYYKLRPEVPGGLGAGTVLDRTTHPPRVSALEFEFDGWLGDDLVTSFPVYLVTDRLRHALEEISLRGCHFGEATIIVSEQLREMRPDFELPQMSWLQIEGRAGTDDFGISSDDYCLVVSDRALACIKRFKAEHCEIAAY